MSANLPPNPNLNQLKNQAKELLAAYQSGDADAIDRVRAVYTPKTEALTLREAKQALAREYGFTSWQALVDEVKEEIEPEETEPAPTKKKVVRKKKAAD